MGFFNYLRLKVLAVIVRFLFRLSKGAIRTSSDKTLQIKSRDAKRTIKIFEYNAAPPTLPQQPGPVLINLHGSGFILPMHGEDEEFCRFVTQKTGYTVLDVQYRLAPENPFPAAVEDVEDVVQYVLSRPEAFDPKRIAISGFSAGGNLALVGAALLPQDTFKCVLAFYPVTDISIEPAEKKTPDPVFHGMPPSIARLFNECYLQGTDPKDPRVSPAFADFNTFPKDVMIITCAGDNLAIEAEELAGKIHEAGKHVVVRRISGVAHAWDKSPKKTEVQQRGVDEAYGLAVEMLNA